MLLLRRPGADRRAPRGFRGGPAGRRARPGLAVLPRAVTVLLWAGAVALLPACDRQRSNPLDPQNEVIEDQSALSLAPVAAEPGGVDWLRWDAAATGDLATCACLPLPPGAALPH
jgi:hypothetical protein